MDANVAYDGESVRGAIRRLYGTCPDTPVKLPHATVPPITPDLVAAHKDIFNTILNSVREQLHSEQRSASAEAQGQAQAQPAIGASPAIAGHWLLSVPPPLWHSEEDVVNYLGMMVAIDFCHWAEVRSPSTSSTASASGAGSGLTVEEGGIIAAPGEPVTGFAGFYTVAIDDEPSASTSKQKKSDISAQLLTEPKDEAKDSSSNGGGCAPTKEQVTLLRGSAAMMLLLRRAVEVHHVPWYDVAFLRSFNGDISAALQAMRVCFMGCEKDGRSPLWMPCARRRVQLLLSLADAFTHQHTSFHQLLRESAGYMFRPPDGTAAARAGVSGFVPSLVRLHPRYHDFARESGDTGARDDSDASQPFSTPADAQSPSVPILKLSQLTALALEQALPPLWRYKSATAATAPPRPLPTALPHSWLVERASQITRPSCSDSITAAVGLFTDHAELSICCDYQIPKTLRAAGLLVYDDYLARVVDQHVLLRPGSVEEASIRIATLVAADRLQRYLNAQEHHVLLTPPQESGLNADRALVQCSVNHLDYALWYIGRYMVPTEARHHLCRTIMY